VGRRGWDRRPLDPKVRELIDDSKHWTVGNQCEGTGEFNDIRGDADVVVSGPTG
jgi:hypothetical protein